MKTKTKFYYIGPPFFAIFGFAYVNNTFSNITENVYSYAKEFSELIEIYLVKVEGIIRFSSFSEVYLASLFIIGVIMVMINFSVNKNEKSFIENIIYYKNNIHLIVPLIQERLPFFLAIGIFVFIINILLNILGLGVIVTTETTGLFCYTLFCKVISIK